MNATSERLAKLPFILSTGSVILGLIIGAAFPLGHGPEAAYTPPSSTAQANFRPLLDGADEMRFILGTNLLVCGKLLLGLATCGMISIAILFWTGITTSWVVSSALKAGIQPDAVAALILPHGLIELGGFSLFGAVGCEALVIVCQKLKHDKWFVDSSRMMLNIRRVFAGFLAVSIASVLEAFLTGQIMAKIN